MTGRQPSALGDDLTIGIADSEYADDTGMPFPTRADVEESICLIYLSALFMASIKDLKKALSATAVARQGRIYRKTLYGDFCRYES